MKQRGGASVEFVALAGLMAAVLTAVVGIALGGGSGSEERWLGTRIAMKIRCAARYPEPCWRDPLAEAYGRPVAGLVRAWAPEVPRVFASRRPIAYTSVVDERRRNGGVTIIYRYRDAPTSWRSVTRIGSSYDVMRFGPTPLLEQTDPRLVPE